MQRKNNGTQKTAKKGEKEFIKVESFQVTRVKETSRGDILFDLILNGVYIYGLSVWTNKQTGQDYISFPSRKGSDGNYYSIAWAKLTDEDSEAILKEVEVQLNAD